jgi:hypothetical protein
MTNTNLLDGVDPDGFLGGDVAAKLRAGCAIVTTITKHCAFHDDVAIYSRETLEPVIEALLEAKRKQVLLEAAVHCEKKADTHGWNYNLPSIGLELGSDFRRMALEPTGVDKGEK